jgi:hypothetical protein
MVGRGPPYNPITFGLDLAFNPFISCLDLGRTKPREDAVGVLPAIPEDPVCLSHFHREKRKQRDLAGWYRNNDFPQIFLVAANPKPQRDFVPQF